MKKIIIAVLCLLLLSGCGGDNNKTKNDTNKNETLEELQNVTEELNEIVEDIKKDENNEENIVEEKPVEETIVEEEPVEETVDNNSIRPEVKEAIDTFETFIDEYCEFMKKYNSSNGTDLSLLADYAKFLAKYADMTDKMDKMESDLTDAELKYYTDVMLRCDKKLIDAAQ